MQLPGRTRETLPDADFAVSECGRDATLCKLSPGNYNPSFLVPPASNPNLTDAILIISNYYE